MSRLRIFALRVCILVLAITGCSNVEKPTELSALPPDAPLVPADEEMFEAYMKRGLGSLEGPELRFDFDGDVVSLPSPMVIAAPASGEGNFSNTNLQTVGVDEADDVKFDGEFLYVARSPEFDYVWPEPMPIDIPAPEPGGEESNPVVGVELDARFLYPETEVITPAIVAVYRASNDPASATPLTTIEIEGASEIRGLMLLGASDGEPPLLVVIAAEGNQFFGDVVGFWDPWYHNAGQLHIHVFDITDPAQPALVFDWRFEGTALAIRRVGNRLILVSSFAPYLRSLADVPDPELRDQLVAEARVEDLLPNSWTGGSSEGRPLVTPDRCFVPSGDELGPERRPLEVSPILATVVTLNLRDFDDRVSICAAGPVDRIYSSTTALYLASTNYDYNSAGSTATTVVHKFAYTDSGPLFRGSGEAPGWPTGSQPGFGLGEIGTAFAILTTVTGSDSEGMFSEAQRLTLLREDPEETLRLVETAHLPNDSNPSPIGKTDERVYGVRFVGDRIYVVTFRQIDPLYVIDVSDVSAPFIAGELELPGFSDFLQPLGGDLLLGVGMASIPEGGFDFFQGVKVELFDVSDASNPQSLDSLELGKRGSSSAARYDHHAVNWMDLGQGNFRVVVPVSIHEEWTGGDETDPRTYYGWSHTGLQLIEVDGLAGQLSHVGEISVERLDWGDRSSWGTGGDRARLQGDSAHYIHGGEVWSASWADPQNAVGPQ